MKAALRIGAITIGAALALGTGASAYAASGTSTPSKLDAVKALAAARIQGRLVTLHALSLAVSDSKYLTSTEKVALSTQISSDLTGLTALGTKMSNETTVDAVRADEVAMVDDYRVYVLMAPQTRLTDGLAAESDAAATLQKAYDALKQMIAQKPGGGTTQQQAQLADLQTQIGSAQSAIGENVSVELAIRPSPNESAIEAALAPVRQATKTAHDDLVKARGDAKSLRASLK